MRQKTLLAQSFFASTALIWTFHSSAQDQKGPATPPLGAARYTGSQACQGCHVAIYGRWKKTPMANVFTFRCH